MLRHKTILIIIFSLFLNTLSKAQIVTTTDSAATIFIKVDVQASYPGDKDAWKKFLIKNMNTSVAFDNGAPIGLFKTTIQFVVNTNGTTCDFTPVSSAGFGTEDEVVRLIKKSGLWEPALLNGQRVASFKKVSVSFLNEFDGINVVTEKPFTLSAGADNTVSITVRKVPLKNLRIVTPEGTIAGDGNGKFIIHPVSTGGLTVDLYDHTTLIIKIRFEVK